MSSISDLLESIRERLIEAMRLPAIQLKALRLIAIEPGGEYVAGGGTEVQVRTAVALSRKGLVKVLKAWSDDDAHRIRRKRDKTKTVRTPYVAVEITDKGKEYLASL